MPHQTELDVTQDWRDDAMEMDCMSDDDFELDDLVDDEPSDLPEEFVTGTEGSVPVWRLIEMSRENRFLERELADFDDYDVFDSYGDAGSDSYMH